MLSLLGLAPFLLVSFLPGLGIGEALDAWRFGKTAVARLAIAFGIGFSFDSVVLMAATSGVWEGLKGISIGLLLSMMGFGLILTVISIIIRKRFAFPVRPKLSDTLVLAFALALGLMTLTYFSKYPIFPQYPSTDFMQHYQIAKTLLSGQTTSFPGGFLYFGVHFQIAAAMAFVGIDPLVARYSAAMLGVVATLFFYLAAQRIFQNETASVASAFLYAIPATVFFGMVFNSGLYAQLYGMTAILFLIVCASALVESLSWKTLPLFLLAVGGGLLAHYSVLVSLPVFLILPLIALVKREKPRLIFKYAIPSIVLSAVAIMGLAVYPSILGIFGTDPNAVRIVGSTPLADLASSIPVVSLMVAETTNDLGFLLLSGLALVSLVRLKRDNLFSVIPAVWLLLVVLIAPFNLGAWRYSFVALIPLTMMAGSGISVALPRIAPHRKQLAGCAIIILAFGATYNGSWGQTLTAPSGDSALYQRQVYSAILWLGDNTPNSSVYYSVTDWRFTYTDFSIGRHTVYKYLANPDQIISVAREIRFHSYTARIHTISNITTYYDPSAYIIVTKFVTEYLPPDPAYYPWDTFTGNENATLVYSNPDVRIYSLTPLAACIALSANSFECPPTQQNQSA